VWILSHFFVWEKHFSLTLHSKDSIIGPIIVERQAVPLYRFTQRSLRDSKQGGL
jgi:hypothetical protein